MTRIRLTILSVLAGSTLACSTAAMEPAPLEFTLTASTTTVARGDTVTFTAQGRGGALIGVEIDFGDATSDIRATGGAVSARITFRHAYTASGTYSARGVVTDAGQGQKDATVQVQVN